MANKQNTSKSTTNSSAKDERRYLGDLVCAGFWRRGFAYGIDSLLFVLVSLVLLGIVYGTYYLISGDTFPLYWLLSRDGIPARIAFASVFQIVWVLAVAGFLSSKWQATPGKRFFRLFVVDTKGQRVVFWKNALRTLLPALVSLVIAVQLFRVETSMWTRMDLEAQKIVKIYAPFYKPLLSHPTKKFYDYLYTEEGNKRFEFLERVIPLAKWQALEFEITTLPQYVQDDYYIEQMLWALAWLAIMVYWYGRISFSYQKSAAHDALLGTRVVIGKR